jgi:hypothetical protein
MGRDYSEHFLGTRGPNRNGGRPPLRGIDRLTDRGPGQSESSSSVRNCFWLHDLVAASSETQGLVLGRVATVSRIACGLNYVRALVQRVDVPASTSWSGAA